MEQLIPVINFLKKNKFWLTTAILSIAMLVTWFITANQWTTQTTADIASIEQSISTGENIKRTTADSMPDGVVAHPNDSTRAGMEEEIGVGVETVLAAWEARRQKQEALLIWPPEVQAVPSFTNFFSRFDPPEQFPKEENGLRLKSLLRIYKQQIPPRMNSIAQIIKTEWKWADEAEQADAAAAESSQGNRSGRGSDDYEDNANRGGPPIGAPGAPGGRGDGRGGRGDRNLSVASMDLDRDIVVQWDETNQDLWHTKLTQFNGYDDNQLGSENLPSPLQVYMLQQDLWLLEAMFNTIAKVNAGAVSNDFANIKRIDHIVFGREAMTQLGELSEITAKTNEAATGPASGAPDASVGRGGRGGPSGSLGRPGAGAGAGRTGAAEVGNSPFDNRYVNSAFEPISADEVRAVYDSAALPTANLELLVARRVPVRIALVMDERKIADFMAACAESEFAFEIHQFRVNRHPNEDPPALANQSTSASESNEGGERNLNVGGGAGGMIGDEGAGVSGSAANGDVPVHIRTSFDVAVEFYGIIKIYNPVKPWLLTGEEPPADEELPETADDAEDDAANADPEGGQPVDQEQPADADAQDTGDAGTQDAGGQDAGAQDANDPNAGAGAAADDAGDVGPTEQPGG